MTADHESAGIFAGRYFGSRTALELEFGSGTASQEQRVTPYFGIGPADGFPGFADDPFIELKTGTNTETEDARLSVRHIGQLGGSTFALSASLRTSRSETHVQLPAPPGMDYDAAWKRLFGLPVLIESLLTGFASPVAERLYFSTLRQLPAA